jgi:hypothetical protein
VLAHCPRSASTARNDDPRLIRLPLRVGRALVSRNGVMARAGSDARPVTSQAAAATIWTMDRHGSLEQWATTEVEARGLRVTAAVSNQSPRPWSTVLRIQTSGGVVWAKQGSPGARYEAALLEILAGVCGDSIATPMAVDGSTGSFLLFDGGPVLGQVLDGAARADAIASWEQVLRRYADLQRAAEPLVDRLIAAGVPDLRPVRIVEVVETMLGQEDLLRLDQADGLASWERTRLVELMPILADLARNADGPIAATVDHNDLHPFNVLSVGPRIFDWGDAVVGYPFASLRRAGDLMTAQPQTWRRAARTRLRRTYLEAWACDVAPADLRRQLRAAPVLGAIAAASTWTRLPRAAVMERPASFPRKLRELLGYLASMRHPGAR